MHDYYLLLTPLLTVVVVALVGFVGCDNLFGLEHVPDIIEGPTNLQKEERDSEVLLTWDASPNADSYKVYLGYASGGPYPESRVVMGMNTYTWPGLTNGTHYYFVVTLTDGGNESERSNEVEAVPGIYGVPMNLVTGKVLGPVSNFNGRVGMGIVVGPNPIRAIQVARLVAPNNSQAHTVRIIDKNSGMEIGSGIVNTAGATIGNFQSADVTPSAPLSSNTTYYLLSDETLTGDQFHDVGTIVTVNPIVSRVFAVYSDAPGIYTETAFDGHCYGPLDLVFVQTP